MPLPADIDFAKDPRADPARMNRAMLSLDGRLRALEVQRKSLDAELAQLLAIGLQRVNDVLQPYYQAVQGLVSLGVLFNARSATQNAIATGRTAFVLTSPDKDRFNYSGFMQAVSASDSRNALLGRFVSFDRDSGRLVVDVMVASGDKAATPFDWMLMPGPPPFVPASAFAADATSGADLQAVPYTLEPTALAVDLGTLGSFVSSAAFTGTLPTQPPGRWGASYLDNGVVVVDRSGAAPGADGAPPLVMATDFASVTAFLASPAFSSTLPTAAPAGGGLFLDNDIWTVA